MATTEDFLSPKDELAIVDAIGQAEKNTSGEIRIHIEKQTSLAPTDRAAEVFHHLQMHETKERNGVLIYLAIDSRQFAIYGDKGIHEKVGNDFWNSTRDVMLKHFKNGDFKQGLIDGVLQAGEQLKKHFPYQEDDVNELPNEISKG